jgi:hypothetical protein
MPHPFIFLDCQQILLVAGLCHARLQKINAPGAISPLCRLAEETPIMLPNNGPKAAITAAVTANSSGWALLNASFHGEPLRKQQRKSRQKYSLFSSMFEEI